MEFTSIAFMERLAQAGDSALAVAGDGAMTGARCV
jgi:hypothetical protein